MQMFEMLDVTRIRHRSPVNPNTTKMSYVLNYADAITTLSMLNHDVCLWGKLQYYLMQYEVYGEMPKFDENNPDDLKIYMCFGMIATKLDENAEAWKAACIKNSDNRKGKKGSDSP